eukprot:7592511-Pyramimonas_sp.AAC.1
MSVKRAQRAGEISVRPPPAMSEVCPENPIDQPCRSAWSAAASPAVPWVSCARKNTGTPRQSQKRLAPTRGPQGGV